MEEVRETPLSLDHPIIIDGVNVYGIDPMAPPLNSFDMGSVEVPATIVDLSEEQMDFLLTNIP